MFTPTKVNEVLLSVVGVGKSAFRGITDWIDVLGLDTCSRPQPSQNAASSNTDGRVRSTSRMLQNTQYDSERGEGGTRRMMYQGLALPCESLGLPLVC